MAILPCPVSLGAPASGLHPSRLLNKSFILPALSTSLNGVLDFANDSSQIDTVDFSYDSDEDYRLRIFFFFNVLFGLLCVVGLAGNLFVIVYIRFCFKFKTVSNVFIFNLAIADALYLSWIPLVIVRNVIKEWPWGSALCKLYSFCTGINRWGSAMFLTLLCVDRFLAICHPISTRPYRTIKAAMAGVFCCWVVVIALMSPLLLSASVQPEPYSNPNLALEQSFLDGTPSNCTGHNISTTPTPSSPDMSSVDDNYSGIQYRYQCGIYWIKRVYNAETNSTETTQDITGRRMFTLYTVFSTLFFIILTWTLYLNVLATVRRNRTADSAGPSGRSSLRQTKRRRVTRMVFVVMACYTVCWIPVLIITILIEYFQHILEGIPINVFYAVMFFSYSLNYFNSAMNPFLYTFLTDTYRQFAKEYCLAAGSRDPLGMIRGDFATGRASSVGLETSTLLRRITSRRSTPDQKRRANKRDMIDDRSVTKSVRSASCSPASTRSSSRSRASPNNLTVEVQGAFLATGLTKNGHHPTRQHLVPVAEITESFTDRQQCEFKKLSLRSNSVSVSNGAAKAIGAKSLFGRNKRRPSQEPTV